MKKDKRFAAILLLIAFCFMNAGMDTAEEKNVQDDDPLPSWNEGSNKKAIIDFVKAAVTKGSNSFVKMSDRIAVFDNDGTLWAEQPLYFQFLFAIDRVKLLAPKHPEWKTKEPFKSVLAGNMKGLMASGEKGLMQIIASTHAGMTTDEFNQTVKDWFKTAKHPKTKRPYNEMVYLPMLELLNYLRANGFKTFIVSGGGIDFMRAFVTEAYGIPPDQVVGSMGKLKYELRNGKPVLVKLPAVDFIDDKEGKPMGIQKFIGQRPVMAFGNSDGDFQMLEWTTADTPPRFALIVHHDDAAREWAYDRGSHIGKLERGLDEASKRGWVLVSMKNDWKKIFPGD